MSVESARRELAALVPAPAEANLASLGVRIAPLETLYRPDDRGVLALLAAVTIVLLLGCFNTAQLLVARGIARGPELALRTALGCGRRALSRMLLIEAGMLSATGALAGLIIALGLLDVFVAADPGHLPGWADVRITPRVALYMAGICAAATARGSGGRRGRAALQLRGAGPQLACDSGVRPRSGRARPACRPDRPAGRPLRPRQRRASGAVLR